MNTYRILALSGLLLAQSTPYQTLVVPDAPDLTIRTREAIDRPDSSVRTETIYVKGARQRRETTIEWPAKVSAVTHQQRTRVATTITQCDKRRTLLLNVDAKTFGYQAMLDPAERFRRFQQLANRAQEREPITGGDVTITIDAVDTGQRRQFGRYTARHVITTIKTEPGPGAAIRPKADERDGWYVDLPSSACLDDSGEVGTVLLGYFQPGGTRDRVRIKRLGTARAGYPIDETNRMSEDGATFTTKLELIELSLRRLDAALFDVPADFRPALPMLSGGFDLTRPDTLVNRVESYWRELVRRANQLFRRVGPAVVGEVTAVRRSSSAARGACPARF
jgi:hypothetical protein